VQIGEPSDIYIEEDEDSDPSQEKTTGSTSTRPAMRRRMKSLGLLIVGAFLGFILLGASVLFYLNGGLASLTAASPTVMASPSVQLTAITRQMSVTLPAPVYSPPATQRTEITATQLPTSTPTVAPALSPTAKRPSTQPQRIFGPESGSLYHRIDGKMQMHFASAREKNFIARVVVYNPYSGGKAPWDTDIFFRATAEDDGYHLVLRSDNRWQLLDERPSELERRSIEIASGELIGLNPRTDAANTIMLIVVEKDAFLLLNNNFITKLDLSMRMEAGDIAIGTGYNGNVQTADAVTHFEDFTVWRITPAFGPLSGMLYHSTDGSVKATSAGVKMWNFIASAHFKNPYPPAMAPWSMGFTFRSLNENDQYRLVAQSDSRWKLGEWKGERITWISEGKPTNFKLAPEEVNHLLLIAWENKGLFYVNGQLVARLDLTSRQYPGDISVATGLLGSDQVADKYTQYQDFTVWGLP